MAQVTIGNGTIDGLGVNGVIGDNIVMLENLVSSNWVMNQTGWGWAESTATYGYFKLNGYAFNWGSGLTIASNTVAYYNYYTSFSNYSYGMILTRYENSNTDINELKLGTDWAPYDLEINRIRVRNSSDSTRYFSFIAIGN